MIKTSFLVLLMMVMGAIGYKTIVKNGYDSRYSAQLNKSLSELKWDKSNDLDSQCLKRYPDKPYCRLGDDAEPTIALIGDSQANQFFLGLSEMYKRSGDTLVQVGVAACPPILGINGHINVVNFDKFGKWCNHYDDIFNQIVLDVKIHTVILAANWHLYFLGNRIDEIISGGGNKSLNYVRNSNPNVRININNFYELLLETIELLEKNNKKVIVLKQIPELDFDPIRCVSNRYYSIFNLDAKCVVDINKELKYLNEYQFEFDNILKAKKGVIVWDPFPIFCFDDYCRSVIDGNIMYRDAWHLSNAGSRYFASRIESSIESKE